MKPLLATAAIAMLFLVGCTEAPPEVAPLSSEAPAAPSIDPGPVKLTDEEAADRYLAIVCQPNVAGKAIEQAIAAGEDEFLNGGEPAVEAIQLAAAEKMRVTRQAIEILDDTYFVWPASVKEWVPHIRSNYMAELNTYSTMANAQSFSESYYASFPEPTAEELSAGQEIRYQLKIDADTTASCAGKEAGQDELFTAMLERNELLAAQSETSD